MARGLPIQPFLLLMMLLVVTAGCANQPPGPRMEHVTIDGHEFVLEVMADEESRTKGMMGRASIPEHGGMLFIFPRSEVRSFWMGHCLVDIDVIFLDAQGRVTAMHRMKAATPQGPEESEFAYRARMPHYWSGYSSQFVIELRAGWLDQLSIRVNDRIQLDLPDLKTLAR